MGRWLGYFTVFVVLLGTPIHLVEAAEDLARALQESATAAGIEETDGGVGDEADPGVGDLVAHAGVPAPDLVIQGLVPVTCPLLVELRMGLVEAATGGLPLQGSGRYRISKRFLC